MQARIVAHLVTIKTAQIERKIHFGKIYSTRKIGAFNANNGTFKAIFGISVAFLNKLFKLREKNTHTYTQQKIDLRLPHSVISERKSVVISIF